MDKYCDIASEDDPNYEVDEDVIEESSAGSSGEESNTEDAIDENKLNQQNHNGDIHPSENEG